MAVDMFLRQFGFAIAERPADKPVRWRDLRTRVVMDEQEAYLRAVNRQRAGTDEPKREPVKQEAKRR